jgi:hypothetical protein
LSWAQDLADDSVPVFNLLGLLGGAGAFFALPITLFAAVMLDIFPETRWLANLIGAADMDTSDEDDAAPDASTRDAGAEHASRERWPHRCIDTTA